MLLRSAYSCSPNAHHSPIHHMTERSTCSERVADRRPLLDVERLRQLEAGLGARFGNGSGPSLHGIDRILAAGLGPATMPSSVLYENTIVRAERVFVALRKAGHLSPGRSPVFHAVTPYCRMSLCADEPGAGSSWAEPPGSDVTCRVCLRRLGRA